MSKDIIYRQDAIDALFELYEYQRDIDPTEAADLVRQGIFLAEKKIEKLPSAKPEPLKIHIDHALTEEEIKNLKQKIADSPIVLMPSAQQERKKGKWIYNSPVTMKCNQCGFVIKDWDWHRFKYCPNCIADMRGESDG